jgi:UDP-galactopyranose mutase
MDFMIVGAGLFGATVAERLASLGRKVLVVEKRPHIGGNCFSEIDQDTGVEVHKYGSHIFHTSNEAVWAYLNQFITFNEYRHTVWTTYQDRVFSMPINLGTINSYYGLNLKPFEVNAFLAKECERERVSEPTNLEEKAISLIGRPLYDAFIKGYTIKQWEADPKTLSPDIISRLPVRHNYSNRYFSDTYEGIPVDGYTNLFERLLDHPNIEVRLNTDYFTSDEIDRDTPTVYTGPVDQYFAYKYGRLDWRTISFEKAAHEMPDFQGCTVMNYADADVPFTRIHEFKHFHPERPGTDRTLTFTEFSRVATASDDLFYPIDTPRNSHLLEQYQTEIATLTNTWFGGRLGCYRYFDMDDTVDAALKLVQQLEES